MSFPIVATGYRSAAQIAVESLYGTPPTYAAVGNPYKWMGAIQQITVTEDKKPVLVYRSDGTISSRYPKYILQGAREIDCSITYWPQDVNALASAIGTNTSTLPSSHTIAFAAVDITGQGTGTEGLYYVKGAVANQITVQARTGQPLSVTIDYYCQDFVENALPGGLSYAHFQGDTNVTPFYFKQESFSVDGNPLIRTLDFQETINNNVARIYQFGQYYLRAAPPLLARVQGTYHGTFQSINESGVNLDDLSWVTDDSDTTGITPHAISLLLGTGHSMSHVTGKFHYVQIPTRITDYIALELHYDAQDITIS